MDFVWRFRWIPLIMCGLAGGISPWGEDNGGSTRFITRFDQLWVWGIAQTAQRSARIPPFSAAELCELRIIYVSWKYSRRLRNPRPISTPLTWSSTNTESSCNIPIIMTFLLYYINALTINHISYAGRIVVTHITHLHKNSNAAIDTLYSR